MHMQNDCKPQGLCQFQRNMLRWQEIKKRRQAMMYDFFMHCVRLLRSPADMYFFCSLMTNITARFYCVQNVY